MEAAFGKQLEQLPLRMYAQLQSAVKKLARRPLTIGSFFSGCEMVMHVVAAINKVIARSFGTQLEWHHTFSAEKDPWKQRFIVGHTPPQHMFGDVISLCNNNWRGDTTEGELVELDAPTLFTAGFECDSVSLLNRWSSGYKNSCVETDTGKTGTTGTATLKFIVDKRPQVTNNKKQHYALVLIEFA